jgi:hypothetical protein
MLTRESRAAIGLHETARLATIRSSGALDTDITGALLKNDSEDDTLFDTNVLGGIIDGVEDAANILTGVTSGEHVVLVQVEESDEVQPLGSVREVAGRAREELTTGLTDVGNVRRGSRGSSDAGDAGKEAEGNG